METTMEKTKVERYPAYKDSGVEWLGEVPEHWEYIRMKHLFRDFSEKNRPGAELLSVTQNQGVVPRTWVENRMVMPSGNLGSFKFIAKGDFAISLRSFEGGLEYCYHDGIISPAYTVLKAKKKFDSQYYKYLFKSFSFISELQTSVVGIREGKNISYNELSYSFLPVPPLSEQTRIANFLDRKTAQIDQAIAQKERLIELLKERRQILIQNAVTRGLNPEVKMKDSGVEWIGEVPEHWEVKRLKFLCHITTGAKNTEDKVDNGAYPFFVRSQTAERINTYSFDGEAILTAGDGAGVGKVFHYINGKFDFHQRVYKFSFFRDVKGIYLFHFIESNFFNVAILGTAKSTVDSLRLPLIQDFWVCYPKSTEEQFEIIHQIETANQKIETATNYQQSQIEKLKEYKSVLINSAVTGKIRV
ncbi:MAG: restriction endonuclease subunit S [Saprospiraceae bacterium]|nr:restriction endonuclease subunit S [Saprospiraceae bacterium]